MKKSLFIALVLAAPLLAAQEPLKEAANWIHGVAPGLPCTQPMQVHEAGPGVFIIRQNKCVNFEAPFLYLILGEKRALLLDSGAQPAEGTALPLLETVNRLVRSWESQRAGRTLNLLVAHTHGHRDHQYFDGVFKARPDTEVVGVTPAAVQSAFGFTQWPEGESYIELGERRVTVFPLPGHEAAHLAFYDHRSGTLFSGDSLYPGLLTVRDWPAFRKSVARMLAFAGKYPVTAIAGAHIEMSKQPGKMYPLGAPFQPNEHPLFLGLAALKELHEALSAQGDMPARLERASFIVEPVAP